MKWFGRKHNSNSKEANWATPPHIPPEEFNSFKASDRYRYYPSPLPDELLEADFTTYAQMSNAVCDSIDLIPYPIMAVYISSWQQELLRLEAFEKRGLTNEQARILTFKFVAGIPIMIWDGKGFPPCPGCGRQH